MVGRREAEAGKVTTGRQRGRAGGEGGGRREGSCFQGRIGWKLLQPRRVVPAAPAPRRAPEPNLFTVLGDAPNRWSLPFTQLCHGKDRDARRCRGKDTQGFGYGSRQSALLLMLDTLKAFIVTRKQMQFSAAFLQLQKLQLASTFIQTSRASAPMPSKLRGDE